ncbi:MAG: glycosyltransferase [Chitinophagaceae bacterium]
MNVLIYISILLQLVYTTLILYYKRGWQLLKIFRFDKEYSPKTKVSIIIPARNEENEIGKLLNDIISQYYPSELMEVIVVNDHSEDKTEQIVKSFKGVNCITLKNEISNQFIQAYKKKAIEIGISKSTGTLIITTDADCSMEPYWLLSIVSFYERFKPKLIAAPVAYSNTSSWFEQFQSLDFLTMQGITGAMSYWRSGTMCNGANLAYEKEAFDAVNGFKHIDHIASGDDMLLMNKIETQFPNQTHYLKCKASIVRTKPTDTLSAFFNQRIRWASKAAYFKDKRILSVLVFIFLYNLLFLLLFLFSFINPKYVVFLFTILAIKTIVEGFFISPLLSFFNDKKSLFILFFLQFLHIPYILISGFLGRFGKYTWKGRKVQ